MSAIKEAMLDSRVNVDAGRAVRRRIVDYIERAGWDLDNPRHYEYYEGNVLRRCPPWQIISYQLALMADNQINVVIEEA